MLLRKIFTYAFIASLLIPTISYAQSQNNSEQATTNAQTKSASTSQRRSSNSLSLTDSEMTLGEQFTLVKKRSSTYNKYKVVPISTYDKLKSNVLDTVSGLKSQINQLNASNKSINEKNDASQKELSDTKMALQQAKDLKESMSFFGIIMTKTMYNTVMWAIIVVLLVLVFIIFGMFKKGHAVTSATKEALNDKSEELDRHRKWALEREQKLARELNKANMRLKEFE